MPAGGIRLRVSERPQQRAAPVVRVPATGGDPASGSRMGTCSAAPGLRPAYGTSPTGRLLVAPGRAPSPGWVEAPQAETKPLGPGLAHPWGSSKSDVHTAPGALRAFKLGHAASG
jgi:hypothetical protein